MKIRRSRKALSPVIASIILIAVTVAVSIAVAAWMGALTFSFMATEQGQVTNLQFNPVANTILVTFNNTGTSAITLSSLWVNNVQIGAGVGTVAPALGSVAANTGTQLTVTMPAATPVTSGYSYTVMLESAKGNKFSSTGSAPS
ncbi:MAG: archaellin/type IV pilin N-terminal domain-containing protein [Candidatus Bathyarchaeia archaeon]|jgi:flagellin-like protein